MIRLSLLAASYVLSLACHSAILAEPPASANAPAKKLKLEPATLPGTKSVHRAGNIYLAGQPGEEAVRELAKRGFKTFITLRHEGEERWDEAGLCKELGIELVRLPIGKPEDIDKKLIDRASKLLSQATKEHGVLMHCASANRVGAVWMGYRVKQFGISDAEARAEGKEVGLSWMDLGEQALKFSR